MAWQPERATGVFKPKCRCVALWELAVDQLTGQALHRDAQMLFGAFGFGISRLPARRWLPGPRSVPN